MVFAAAATTATFAMASATAFAAGDVLTVAAGHSRRDPRQSRLDPHRHPMTDTQCQTTAMLRPALQPSCTPHFTPDINLGHLIQAIVVVTTVGGGALGGYLSLRADIDLQRGETRAALAGHEARLTVAERLLEERHTEDRQYQSEMRAALDRIMVSLGDLRTELVQKQDRK